MCRFVMSWIVGCGVVAWLSGCQKAADAPAKPAPAAAAPADAPPTAKDAHKHEREAAGEHEHEEAAGPHGGHLLALGANQYQAELLHDEKTETTTVYLLDAAGKKPVSADEATIVVQIARENQFVSYTLKAADGDVERSKFSLQDESLCDALSHGTEAKGRLTAKIKGQSHVGRIEHTAHSH
jgi:hypothetical protein